MRVVGIAVIARAHLLKFIFPKILGPVHMHTFTYVSKVTYVSKFTNGACERTYSREYKYSLSKLG